MRQIRVIKTVRSLGWTGIVILIILVAWMILILRPEHIEVRPSQAGCYKGASPFSDVILRITSTGMLTFSSKVIPVYLTRDKEGFSFEAQRKIVLAEEKHLLTAGSGSSDLLRINKDGSFYLPTDKGNLVLFAPCDLPLPPGLHQD
jgi:hypothetical protein